LVVSRAQGEYEALEKEKEDADARVAQGQKRDLDGEGDERSGKKAKTNGDEDEEEMEMDEDDDGTSTSHLYELISDTPAAGASGSKLICTNLPPECTEEIMGALFAQYVPPSRHWIKLISRYPGYTSATSLPPAGTNPGAKAFSVTFASPAQAESALGQTKGFLMQPGWEMEVSKA
jgi:hypothetical protein